MTTPGVIYLSCRVVLAAIIALVLSWELSLVCFSLAPPYVIVNYLAQKKGSKYFRKIALKNAEASERGSEAFVGAKTVIVNNLVGEMLAKYQVKMKKVIKLHIHASFIVSLGFAYSSMSLHGLRALCFWYGVEMLKDGDIEPGDIATMFSEIFYATLPLLVIIHLYGALMSTRGSVSHAFSYMKRKPRIYDKPNCQTPSDLKNTISFKDVHFAYPSRKDAKVLKGFSLDVIFFLAKPVYRSYVF